MKALALALLAGCGAADPKVGQDGADSGQQDSGQPDSGGADGSDGSDGADGADGSDGTDGGSGGTPVIFEIDGGDDAFALLQATAGSTGWEFGAALVQAEAPDSGNLALDLPDPPDSLLQEDDNGVWVGIFAPIRFDDGDGNGDQGRGEPLSAFGLSWMVWLGGTLPGEYTAAGLRPGWNALAFDFIDGGIDRIDRIDAVPLPSNFAVRGDLDLGGTGTVIEDAGMLVIPQLALEGAAVSSLLLDQPLDSPWAVALRGRPPADHMDTDGGLRFALEVVLAYADLDRSGGANEGDAALYAACTPSGETAYAAWFDAPEAPQLALYMAVTGYPAGWAALAASSTGPRVLSTAEALDLRLDASCPGL